MRLRLSRRQFRYSSVVLTGAVLPTSAADDKFDGELKPFLGEPTLETTQVFKDGRFPNVVVAIGGTVLAVWGGVVVRRSEDGGKIWGPEIEIGKGHMGGGVTVNAANGEIFAFVGKVHPPPTETV